MFQFTAEGYEKSTSGWRASPKNVVAKLPDGGKGETAKQGNHQKLPLFTPGLQNILSLTSDALNLTW